MNVEDGSFERLKLPQWTDLIQAEWMPDDKTIMILAKEKPNDPFQIWKVDYPRGFGTRISNDAHDYRYLSIPTGGQFILATQERTFFNLWAIPVDDPAEARPLTFSWELLYGQQGISWTPDGEHLVYARTETPSETNIWKLNLQTLEQLQLTFDEQRTSWSPRVTPEGSVIFSSNRAGGTHIWSMDLDGGNLRQITDGIGEGFSNISSDGKWLVYASPARGPESTWKKSLTTDEPDVKILDGAAGSNAHPRTEKR